MLSKIKKTLSPIIGATLSMVSACVQDDNFEQAVSCIVEGRDMMIGVAICTDSKEFANINGDMRFPMQSIYKLPIAMAYLDAVGGAIPDNVEVSKSQLLPNTWSPFREDYPDGEELSVRDFVTYVVAKSDNNLCDVMIDMAGGIAEIDLYLKAKGAENVVVKNYERDIQSSWDVQFENYATPNSIIKLLRQMGESIESGAQSSGMLWEVMCNTNTGSARKLISPSCIVGYKTGFSGKNTNGVTAANNCVGILKNRDGKMVYFAIFITDSREAESVNYSVISQIIRFIEKETCRKK